MERKSHLVKWATIYSERRHGGLSVKNLSILNKALIIKWSWWYASEKEAWWVEVIKRKYGEEEGRWSSHFPRENYGVGLWKSLRRWSFLISNHYSFVVGDGKKTKFWKNSWYGDTSLNAAYPSSFTIACKECLGGGCVER